MSTFDIQQRVGELMNAGYAAMAQGQWEESRRYFDTALAQVELPEILEGRALAAYWVDDVPTIFANRERAYRLYRARDDRAGAARVACTVANDYLLFRGEEAVANGWLERARRLLDGLEPSIAHGFLAITEGFTAILVQHDLATALNASRRAFALAQALHSLDLEVGALTIEGLALVFQGRIAEGMGRLDEATTAALAGEVQSLDAVVSTCCCLISACEHVRDFDRAAQWCARASAICRQFHYRSMLAYCRTHYAAVLLWQGDWAEAEAELVAATRELSSARIGMAVEGIVRLAELRRQQRRPDLAAALLAQVQGHPIATLVQAALAFDAGDVVTASDLVERFLRQVPAENLVERVEGLQLAVQVRCAQREVAEARDLVAQLAMAAVAVGTAPLQGALAGARGHVAAAAGDRDEARRRFEDALDCFQRSGAPFEAARARVDLAEALIALERRDAAAAELRAALATLHRIGALREASRAARLLEAAGVPAFPHGEAQLLPAGLTPRESEILGLLARGRSNQEIAGQLYLSIRTVERHISNIYSKIGADGPAARAIASSIAFANGLA